MTRAYDYTKRWRQTHTNARHDAKQRNYAQTQDATNSRQPWSSADIEAILAEDRPSDRELSKKLGRSVQAIQLKRSKWTRG